MAEYNLFLAEYNLFLDVSFDQLHIHIPTVPLKQDFRIKNDEFLSSGALNENLPTDVTQLGK